ncbi:hypothetical protein [Polyangium fumosum]|uniref:Uncharacterized protein n=1 Tax=Polyangium fumosum TaxID=889272 RepID=A0A4U1JK06_9BACT|nr:hypothetical protein [Polyangium fumosum]TKD13076.1 hypothetical protein E8A74_00525 [Polyangium fumosum]
MTRRKKLIAAALALPLALALGVGLTARRAGSDPLSVDLCDKDLAAVFESCKAEGDVCTFPDEGMEEACQAGCVMMTCPNHVSCTELDPTWCKPCDDEQGAPYWRILLEAERLCFQKKAEGEAWTLVQIEDSMDCLKEEGERMCPALAAKPYWHWKPEVRKRCQDDLDLTVRRCEEDDSCALAPEEYKKACQEGCLLRMCPDQVACTGDDPVRCAPCEDAHGALHWRHVFDAEIHCHHTEGEFYSGPPSGLSASRDKWAACFVAEMERECRALAGTAWWRRAPFLVEHYGNARPSPAPPASPAAP